MGAGTGLTGWVLGGRLYRVACKSVKVPIDQESGSHTGSLVCGSHMPRWSCSKLGGPNGKGFLMLLAPSPGNSTGTFRVDSAAAKAKENPPSLPSGLPRGLDPGPGAGWPTVATPTNVRGDPQMT